MDTLFLAVENPSKSSLTTTSLNILPSWGKPNFTTQILCLCPTLGCCQHSPESVCSHVGRGFTAGHLHRTWSLMYDELIKCTLKPWDSVFGYRAFLLVSHSTLDLVSASFRRTLAPLDRPHLK